METGGLRPRPPIRPSTRRSELLRPKKTLAFRRTGCHHAGVRFPPHVRPLPMTRLVLAFLACLLAAPRLWAGETSENAWIATRTFPAAEAHQAVAADAEFAYVINSTRVARYDRRSGKRLAESRGAARHLNSGFLHDGKLYCAHSNYPQKPEQSEIKVLDLGTMELTDFHAFGNYGGSLTWCVRDGDSWWCNFAHYGRDNGRTFLAKFDDRWREQGRWTYPAELTERLGDYSLSGGIKNGDTLLVTGHDDPVLFELRLPPPGSELVYVGQHSIPFTGQGFAADPLTKGLVGIDRGKRLVVFAEPAP